ncbi:MAG: hypothetical protein HQK53_11950 [Oligoflexia bacterium]|nr:hypothetical protein [Oligoflexia bacterium]
MTSMTRKFFSVLATSTLLVSVSLFSSSSEAMDRCGLLCRHEAFPFYQQCDRDLALCNTTENSSLCQIRYTECKQQALKYQISCVEECLSSQRLRRR